MPTFKVAQGPAELKDSDSPIIISGSIDQPGDLGYHSEQNGIPWGIVLFDGSQTTANVEQSTAHESGELIGDPDVDRYDDDNIWVELFDPLENDADWIEIDDPGGPALSSPFALPPWFNFASKGYHPPVGCPVDSAGLLSVQHQLRPGGYYGKRDGSNVMGHRRTCHSQAKLGPFSRRTKRHRNLGLAPAYVWP